jgi:hypothetical protein
MEVEVFFENILFPSSPATSRETTVAFTLGWRGRYPRFLMLFIKDTTLPEGSSIKNQKARLGDSPDGTRERVTFALTPTRSRSHSRSSRDWQGRSESCLPARLHPRPLLACACRHSNGCQRGLGKFTEICMCGGPQGCSCPVHCLFGLRLLFLTIDGMGR